MDIKKTLLAAAALVATATAAWAEKSYPADFGGLSTVSGTEKIMGRLNADGTLYIWSQATYEDAAGLKSYTTITDAPNLWKIGDDNYNEAIKHVTILDKGLRAPRPSLAVKTSMTSSVS